LAGVAVGGGQYRNAVASGRRPCHNQERSYTLIDRRYRVAVLTVSKNGI